MTTVALSPGMSRGPECPGRRPPRLRGLLGPTSTVESSAAEPALEDSAALAAGLIVALTLSEPTSGAEVASAASSAADAARTWTLTRLRRISSRRSVEVFWAFSTDINRLLGNTASEDPSEDVLMVSVAEEGITRLAAACFTLATAVGAGAKIMGGGASPPPADGGLSVLAGDCGRDGACGGVGGGSARPPFLIFDADVLNEIAASFLAASETVLLRNASEGEDGGSGGAGARVEEEDVFIVAVFVAASPDVTILEALSLSGEEVFASPSCAANPDFLLPSFFLSMTSRSPRKGCDIESSLLPMFFW